MLPGKEADFVLLSMAMQELETRDPFLLGIVPFACKVASFQVALAAPPTGAERVMVMLETRKDGSHAKELLPEPVKLNGNPPSARFQAFSSLVSDETLEPGAVLYCDIDYQRGEQPSSHGLVVTVGLQRMGK